MQEWPNDLALVSTPQLRTDTTVQGAAGSSSTDGRGEASQKAMEDLPEPDRSEPGVSTATTGSLIGRTLSRYRVLELIGCGGMGVVYRAFDKALRREVALKLLRADRVADVRWRLRFRQEAQTAASLQHPRICLTHEIDEADGMLFIAMELIRGERLLDVLRRAYHAGGHPDPSPLPLSRALDLGTEIAQGLARAHEQGIVHLDLKPSNVMITESGHVKLIDFGLAKLLEPASSIERTVSDLHQGRICGTRSYMSPEQSHGLAVDQRSDIFTFGVLLREMLTGANPLRPRTRARPRNGSPSALAPPAEFLVAADVTPGLQYVLDRCLARAPRDRYQNMGDVLADLREVRSWVGSPAFVQQAVPRSALDALSSIPWIGGPAVGWISSGPTRPQGAGRPLSAYDGLRPQAL